MSNDSGALPHRPATSKLLTEIAHTSLAEVADGRFVRPASVDRNKIQKGGEFPPAAGRYHLYVSLACPWAHRTVIFRKLKGLEKAIGLSIVEPAWGPVVGENDTKHWIFAQEGEVRSVRCHYSPLAQLVDKVNHLQSLRAVYKFFNHDHQGKVTTPLLVDLVRMKPLPTACTADYLKQTKRIVNNESSEILVFFNSEFNEFAENPSLDLIPADLKPKIEEINNMIYNSAPLPFPLVTQLCSSE